MKLRSSASKRIETWKADAFYLPVSEPGSFPLMRLPLELRVKVYEQALISEEAFWIYRSTPVPPTLPFRHHPTGTIFTPHPAQTSFIPHPVWDPNHQSYRFAAIPAYLPTTTLACSLPINIALLRACKAVYTEALPVLYKRNKFIIPSEIKAVTSLSQLSGPGLSLLSYLDLKINHGLTSIFQHGNPTFWDMIIRSCPALKQVSLSFDYHVFSWRGLLEAIIGFAHGIASLGRGVAIPLFLVRVTVHVSDHVDFRTFAWQMVESPKGRKERGKQEKVWKYVLPKAEVLTIYCQLPPDVLSIVGQFSKNGWRFKKTTIMAKPNPKHVSSYVELAWTKDRYDAVCADVAGQKTKRYDSPDDKFMEWA